MPALFPAVANLQWCRHLPRLFVPKQEQPGGNNHPRERFTGFASSERFTNSHRSKSTSKIRTHNKEGNTNSTFLVTCKFQENKKSRDGFGKFLQRGVSPDNNGASKRTTLPSAWALSPGRRSLGSPVGSESPAKANGSGGGGVVSGVGKVLKYFKHRKVPSKQEEVYHRFKILHNRLLQWRFVNARADVTKTNVKNAAEADIVAIFEALNTAIKVMENIEPLIMKYQTQVERILYQVTELTTTSKQEEVCLQELLGIVPIIATLLENEKSIRVYLIQTKMESNPDNYPCNIAQPCTSNAVSLHVFNGPVFS